MSTSYRRNPDTAGRIVDGLAFVVTPEDNKLHTLNETATEMWILAEAGCTAEQAAQALVEQFEVALPEALRDVQVCLEDLVERQILVAD